MGLEAVASLVVAAFDLIAVRSIRDAIRTADLSSGKGMPATALGPSPNPLIGRPVGGPGGPSGYPLPRQPDAYCPGGASGYGAGEAAAYDAGRRAGRRDAVVEPGRYGVPAGTSAWCEPMGPVPAGAFAAPLPAGPTCALELPIPPVWKTLPPVEHPRPIRRHVKVVARTTDIRCRGLVLDVHA